MPFYFGYDYYSQIAIRKKGEREKRSPGSKTGNRDVTSLKLILHSAFGGILVSFPKLFKFSKVTFSKVPSLLFPQFKKKNKKNRLGEWLAGSGKCSQGIIVLDLVIVDIACKRAFD